MAATTYGIKDICERFAVGEHTALGWIRSGELKAVNVNRRGEGRPKWRITAEALAAFEQLRTPSPPTPKTARKKKRSDMIEFYK